MTIEDRKKIAIAKEFRWTEVTNHHQALKRYEYRIIDGYIYTSIQTDMPDYFGDLNASHEMEKLLHSYGEVWFDYCESLFDYEENSRLGNMGNVHATAAQKADTFIKVLNLEY